LEPHNIVAICVILAMAFLIDSTVKLWRYRKRNGLLKASLGSRDIKILMRPNDYEVEEARLTYKNWVSVGAMLTLMLIFWFINPDQA
jgi:hypothetical protein